MYDASLKILKHNVIGMIVVQTKPTVTTGRIIQKVVSRATLIMTIMLLTVFNNKPNSNKQT